MIFIKDLFGPKYPEDPGAIPDPRPPAEKDQDYEVEEVLPPMAPIWEEKPRDEWRRMPVVKSQDGSSGCVAFGVATALGYENVLEEGKFLDLSPRPIYKRRKNSGPGMWLQDGLHIPYKTGTSLEVLMPSDGKNEEEMNDLSDEKEIDRQIGKVVKPGGYVQGYNNDFNKIAVALELGKMIPIIIRFESGQLNNPIINTTYRGKHGHLMCVTDKTLYNGKRALVVGHHWGERWGWSGHGLLLEDRAEGVPNWGFFKALDNDWQEEDHTGAKPSYEFNVNLAYGDRNNEVAKLQEVLKWEEVFPKDVPCTGYFGQISAKAVYDFQVKHEVADMAEIDALQGMAVGPKTRAKLTQLYAN